jgi:hypothetical protein
VVEVQDLVVMVQAEAVLVVEVQLHGTIFQ